ncbi:MAG: class I SAM-dependent methyltransferase [Candidatus Omnitrophota bacterium]|jgi:ubiquinone/menaquinone biosynthesis C-methylase UbiE
MIFQKHKIEWTPEKISRLWDYYSTNPSYHGYYFGFQASKAVAKEIQRRIHFKKLHNILDFSCGLGDLIQACSTYLRPGQNIYGVDFSENSVKATQTRFINNPSFQGAILLKSFPSVFHDEFFDLIMSTEVIEHLSETEFNQMLIEANRLLKNNGYIFLTTRNRENLKANEILCPECGCIFHRWQHLRTWDRFQLDQAVTKFGFETVTSEPISWRWPLLRKILFYKEPKGLLYVGRKTSPFSP